MKTSQLPLVDATDGSEEIVIVRGPANAKVTALLPPSLLADAAVKPTPDELKAAILNALVDGDNINLTQNADGTVGIEVITNPSFKGVPTAPTADPATNTTQIATTAFVQAAAAVLTQAINGKQAKLDQGAGINIADNGDGTFTISATGGGTASALTDGVYGDITVSNGGTKMTVTNVTNGTVTVPDEAYGAAWSGKLSVPTKNALYNEVQTLNTAINGRVANTAVGAANGVATLDSTGKVPAAQLPSYVDDVLEFSSLGTFPASGETGKIYVADDTNAQYRWSGSGYIELVASPGTTDAVPEGSTNKYYTDVRVRASVMTGLASTVGTPAATDSLLAVLGKLYRQCFGGILLPVTGGVASGSFAIDGAAASTRQFNFLSAGGYSADIQLMTDNATLKHNATTAHRFDVSGAQKFIVTTNGATVSGTMLSSLFAVSGAGGAYYYQPRDGNANQPFTYSPTGNDLRFYCNGDVLQIVPGQVNVTGNLYSSSEIWTNAKVIRFGGAGSLQFIFYDGTKFEINGAVTLNGFDFSCGNISASGNITSSSDRRLKSDIRTLTGAREILAAIGSYRFTMHDKQSVGVIAQEVEAVLPEFISTDENGMLGVDYGKLTAVLIADNNAMAERLAALEAMVAKLAA